jgi:hypothetical protein
VEPTDDEVETMIAATWSTVEALGVPDTPMRRVLFDLARLVITSNGPELRMAMAAFHALSKEMQEAYQRKTPLQQQLEHIRTRKELAAATGLSVTEVRGDRFVLDPLPETPVDLSVELGYEDGGRAVRRLLREKYPHEAGASWTPLSEAQVNYVRAHLAPKVAK